MKMWSEGLGKIQLEVDFSRYWVGDNFLIKVMFPIIYSAEIHPLGEPVPPVIYSRP